jgi:lipid-binding SYLF domain-containing protein
MKPLPRFIVSAALASWGVVAFADAYDETIELFRNAGESAMYFDDSYGYAVFPNIGKGGFVVGGARGKGRVFEHGQHVGNATVTQLSVGFQAGGQAFSQVIFFEDERAFKEFTSGQFEFGADASAVVITAAVSGTAGSGGTGAGASGGKKDARTVGAYHKGMAVFTIVKGGAMYEVALGGQKYSYQPLQ